VFALVAAVMSVVLAAGCSGAGSPIAAPPTSSTAASPTPATSVAPLPSVSESPSATDNPLFAKGFPHDARELEALLPKSVAGRKLTTWSVRGTSFMTFLGITSPEAIAEFEHDVAADGLTLQDLQAAVGGRTDTRNDPPYFVLAYQFGQLPAVSLPIGLGVDRPDLGEWRPAIVGGKSVQVGTLAMLEQSTHVLGQPYVYSTGAYRFVVATDDPDWAADALEQLP
jgi:hypothetical protein